MSGATVHGADLPLDPSEHFPLDRLHESNRAGHGFAYGGDEDTVRIISDPDVLSAVPDPDASIHDPLSGVTTRLSRIPVALTIRQGFEDDEANLGKRAELVSPLARPDPLQSMEDSPTYVRQTLRVTPGPWDERLLIRGSES